MKIEVSATDLQEAIKNMVSDLLEQHKEKKPPERYITPKITARELDVSLSTLWRWNKEGYLKPVAIGGKRRYKLSDIEKIKEGGCAL